jgi:hypothetical protein
MTEAERIAQTLGFVLGAAINCEQVTDERLNSLAVKMRTAVLALVDDEAEVEATSAYFTEGIEAGRSAAENGDVEPEAVETALEELEEQLSA